MNETAEEAVKDISESVGNGSQWFGLIIAIIGIAMLAYFAGYKKDPDKIAWGVAVAVFGMMMYVGTMFFV